jgi:hypothetical protein
MSEWNITILGMPEGCEDFLKQAQLLAQIESSHSASTYKASEVLREGQVPTSLKFPQL